MSEETKKIDIYDILKNHLSLDIFKIKTFDCIKQKVITIYYVRFNCEFKIEVNKNEFYCLRALGIREVLI